jgi:tRNA isopentenyl-2-thiomethyl-A-37 hydroxylase MiaE
LKDVLKDSLSKLKVESTKEVEQILAKKISSNSLDIEFSELWDASSFHLNRLSSFQKSDKPTQNKILEKLSIGRFLEAYNIEKAGMSFAAKMSLLAESINEQKLYSLFCAEEATHFHYIQKVLESTNVNYQADPFIKLLNEVVMTGERRPLIFIIQVVLEGWGIDHYSLMERSCLNPEIKKHLRLILQDEASHHGSGLSLFNDGDFSEAEFSYTADMMAEFLQMVNCGPVGVLSCLETYLPKSQLASANTELRSFEETQRKLDYIKSLMIKAKSHKLIEKLEKQNLFLPSFS